MVVHTADADETKLSCLVRVGGVNTIGDQIKLFCLLCSCFHTADMDKTIHSVLSLPSFQIMSHFAIKLSGSLNDQISVTDLKTHAFSVVSTTQVFAT